MIRKLYDGHGKGSKSRLFQLYPYNYSKGYQDGQKEIGKIRLVGIDETSEFTRKQMEYLTRRRNSIVDMLGRGGGAWHYFWDKYNICGEQPRKEQ